MKILNFGSCNIDYVYSLHHIVEEGETETADRMEIFPGGKGLNQSIAAARAGARVYQAGCVGSDGLFLETVLRESGVDVGYMRRLESKNGHAMIQVGNGGENAIFIYPGSNEKMTPEYVDEVLSAFDRGDLLLLQNEINAVDYIVEKAYARGLTVLFNPSPYNEKIAAVDFQKLSYLILNEVEAQAITGAEEPEECLAALKKRYPALKVLLTLGEKGSMLMDGEALWRQVAYVVEPVDTTAAGDTFTGYFAAGRPVCEALRDASLASAVAVSKEGASPSIPTAEQVRAAASRLSPYPNAGNSRSVQEKIEDYFARHLQNASLSELAEALGYSAVYTGSLFRKLFGRSYTECLQEKRCAEAARLLIHSDASIRDIVGQVGYENESFFRRVFRERYGENPLEFRKKRRG